jgi:UPF0755 protein
VSRQAGFIAAGLGALAVVFVSVYLIWFAPADFRGSQYIFTIERGQSLQEVVVALKQEGFIRSVIGTRIAFKLNRAGVIQAGTYNISPRMDAWQIAHIINGGQTAGVKVTIPEGFTVSQIADLLNQQEIIMSRDFITLAGNFPPDFEFLVSRPDNSLEGYLFPDTYNMNKGTPARDLILQMLDNFKARINSIQDLVTTSKYNLHQIITLASLVEKEARTDADRKLIAGVLLRRLEIGMRLDVDATVRYLANNWTGPITQAQLNSNSPYNTRKVAGLPPGPICNPGLAAIQAVLSPTKSDYLYYLHDAEGNTHYAKTLEQHNINKANYL